MPPQDSQKRLLLAFALIAVVTAIFSLLQPKPPPPEAEPVVAEAEAPTPAPSVPPAGVEGEGGQVAQAAPPGEPPPPVRQLTKTLQGVDYVLTTQGAGLTSAVLQGEKMRVQQRTGFVEGWRRFFGGGVEQPAQMDLAEPLAGGPLPLAVSISGGAPLPPGLAYAAEETPNGFVFRGTQGPWRVEKQLLWPADGFQLLYTVTVTNTSEAAQSGELAVHYTRAVDPQFEEAPSLFGSVGNQARVDCRVADELQVQLPSEDPPESFTGPVRSFGIDQQYFTSQLFLLDGARQGKCTLAASATARAVEAAFPLSLAPGESTTLRFGGYLGPKDTDVLAAVPSPQVVEAAQALGVTVVDPQLEELVDFGIWAVLCKLLLAILKFFHGVFGNWGIAIVLLTVVVKLVLLPLTMKQLVSMEEMKKLQPRMEAIRKKYADDRERQQVETMKLYQEAKVNPLGGCLPLLLQMPVWIALFTALRHSYDIYSEPFFGPVWNDLTYKDPTYILPVLLGVTMIVTQKLQPQMMDAAQARIMTWVMPIFFTFIMLNYPAGLTLYIFTNNALSIGQQYGLRKWMERRKAATA